MAWTELTPATAELSLKTTGVIEWNTRLQLAMGDPDWVNLMWDAGNRELGIRAVNSPTGQPVAKEPETGEFRIDSAEILNRAGISVAENVSAEPETWYNPTAPPTIDPEASGFGYNAIYYITLPE